jgi:hypothetical protein
MPKTADLPDRRAYFAAVNRSTFKPSQLNDLFFEKQDEWRIPRSWGPSVLERHFVSLEAVLRITDLEWTLEQLKKSEWMF